MRFFAIFLLFLASISSSMAIVDPPKLLRICLNGSDSIATLQWTVPNDACGSFTEYHIYGRENAGAYQLLAIEKNRLTTTKQIKLSSAEHTWNFYIETLHTCNGTDSVASNSVKVDKDQPADQVIDSVSVDLATQKIIVGWPKNPSPDVKWYRVYEFTGAANSRIGDTSALEYMLKQHSPSSLVRVRLAAFDSCDNPSGISDWHIAMNLNHSVDTCAKTITLNWSAYVGWNQIDRYEVYANKNGSGYSLAGTSASTSYVYSDFVLGDQICFFIRAFKTDVQRITSSSTEVCLQTRAKVVPSVNYLSKVSVLGDEIETEWRMENGSDVASVDLLRDDGAGAAVVYSEPYSGNSYNYLDPSVSVNSANHEYFVQAKDVCNNVLSESNKSKNILLQLARPTLTWNAYTGWQGSVQEYVVEQFDGSTWNIITSTTNLAHNLDSSFFKNSVCLRVRAIETGNPVADEESISNQVCTDGDFTFYIPNAMNPENEENYFKVVGTNVDYARSEGFIFNRWGEKLVQINNLEVGWDGMVDGDQLPLGIYYYKLDVYSLNGRKQEAQGYIRIIR